MHVPSTSERLHRQNHRRNSAGNIFRDRDVCPVNSRSRTCSSPEILNRMDSHARVDDWARGIHLRQYGRHLQSRVNSANNGKVGRSISPGESRTCLESSTWPENGGVDTTPLALGAPLVKRIAASSRGSSTGKGLFQSASTLRMQARLPPSPLKPPTVTVVLIAPTPPEQQAGNVRHGNPDEYLLVLHPRHRPMRRPIPGSIRTGTNRLESPKVIANSSNLGEPCNNRSRLESKRPQAQSTGFHPAAGRCSSEESRPPGHSLGNVYRDIIERL